MNKWRYAVACCGCGLVLGGTPDGNETVLIAGLKVDKHALETAPVFPGKEGVDKACKAAGWTTKNGEHRCPKCGLARRAQSDQGGMYIDLDSWKQVL